MAYEIVKFSDDAGQQVQITPQDVRQTFCHNATDQEVQLFLALCATQRLNPFTKEAYLVKYGNGPASIITSRAAIQKRADANPDYEGVELGVVILRPDGTIEHRPGEACYKQLGEQLVGGWARAYRRGRKPYYSEVPMAEYSTGKSNWAKMPGTMITKVAEMHALRGAFPQDFQGMYGAEEMDQAQERPAQQVSVAPAPAAPAQHDKADSADIDKLRAWTADLAAKGYVEAEVKAFLWQRYKAEGLAAARTAYEGMAGAVGAEPAQAPDGASEAIEPDEYEPTDIEF